MDNNKKHVVSIRLNDEDYQALAELAALGQLTVSKTCSMLIHVGLIIATDNEDTSLDETMKKATFEVLENAKL